MKTFRFALLIIFFFSNTSAFSQGYSLTEQKFFDNLVSVQIPSTFVAAPEIVINERFPDTVNRAKIILTDSEQRALIALNVGENTGGRDTIIHFYKDIKDSIRQQYPNHRFLRTDVIRNRTLAIIEVIIPDNTGKMLYNMMAFRYIGDKFFFFNFSCPEEDMEKWQNAAREIAENIKVN